MNDQTFATEYADLVGKLGALLAARRGEEALSDDDMAIVATDLMEAIADALPA